LERICSTQRNARRISAFYGIVIQMYYGDHPPPHFHVRYGGGSAKVEIEGASTAPS
jgi:hypothetical protein